MRCVVLAFLCALAFASSAPVRADILVVIDKSDQRMSVAVDGTPRYSWPISTARRGYVTPNGTYRPKWLARKWFSRKYYNSPMPYSIFFHKGFAIHGSYEISRLGRPASHGCVRLHPRNAAILFALVKEEGRENTQIVVTGERPAYVAKSKPRRRHQWRPAGTQRRPVATVPPFWRRM